MLTSLTFEHILCSVNQQFEMLSATTEWWNQIHLLVDTQCEVTWPSTTLAPADRERSSRASERALITQRRAATVSLTEEQIAVLFTGCECELLGPRLMIRQQLNWIDASLFSGDGLRRKAELFWPDTLPNALHACSCIELRQKNYSRTLSWKNTRHFPVEMSEDSLSGRCYLYRWCFYVMFHMQLFNFA